MFGIPNLLRQLPRAVSLTLLGRTAQRIVDAIFPDSNWGVFLVGTTTKAFDVSSVSELGISGESYVSTYPIESGSFTTYNKVTAPNAYQLRMTKDGSESERGAFLDWLELNKNTTTVFDVLCPERVYRNVTLASYRVMRSASSGAGMVVVDCLFQEIRELSAQYSSTKIAAPGNRPATPAARVNPVSAPSVSFPE